MTLSCFHWLPAELPSSTRHSSRHSGRNAQDLSKPRPGERWCVARAATHFLGGVSRTGDHRTSTCGVYPAFKMVPHFFKQGVTEMAIWHVLVVLKPTEHDPRVPPLRSRKINDLLAIEIRSCVLHKRPILVSVNQPVARHFVRSDFFAILGSGAEIIQI